MYEELYHKNGAKIELDRPYRADIHNTVTTDGEDLFVTIDGIDKGEHKWGPCLGWEPRNKVDGSVQLPYKGADALVVFDSDHDLWLLEWWPYA